MREPRSDGTWWGDKFLGVDSNGNDAAKVGAGGGVLKPLGEMVRFPRVMQEPEAFVLGETTVEFSPQASHLKRHRRGAFFAICAPFGFGDSCLLSICVFDFP